MKDWKKQAMSLLLAVLMSFSVVTPVAAQPETAEYTGKAVEADYVMVMENPEESIQSVVICANVEGTLSQAVLTYQDGEEELQVQAAMLTENYARFDLPIPEEGCDRVYLNMTGVCDGTWIQMDLTSAEEEESVEVDSETVLAAVQEEEIQETESETLPEEMQDCVIEAEADLSGESIAEAVNAIAEQSEEVAAVRVNENTEKLRSAAKKEYVVVLDAGHGNVDSGTCFTYDGVLYKESELVLKIAKYAKEELEKQDNITVYMTRSEDTDFMKLTERVAYADSVDADILVSLHINAVGDGGATTAHGALVIVPHTGRYNNDVAENAQGLAQEILEELVALGLYDRGFLLRDTENGSTYPDGSKGDYYTIIHTSLTTGIPGIIVEHGFLNNEGDFRLAFSSEEQLQALGVADAKGIIEFLSTYTPAEKWGWELIDGKWYYMNQDGEKHTGWLTISSGKYYLNKKGVMLTGLQTINKKLYYFHSSGCMLTGWQQIGDDWYYFGSNGAAYQNKWYDGYYLGEDGVWIENYQEEDAEDTSNTVKLNGWQLEKNIWYYYVNGTKHTGWLYVGGHWYYLNTRGEMQIGWVKVKGIWYYLNASGAMQTGWLYTGGYWYYLNASGAMQTGWVYTGGHWYYLSSSGAMLTGWVYTGGYWYYLSSSGAMLTGWQLVNGKWYYMYASGAMAANTTIGGYRVGADGAWIQ